MRRRSHDGRGLTNHYVIRLEYVISNGVVVMGVIAKVMEVEMGVVLVVVIVVEAVEGRVVRGGRNNDCDGCVSSNYSYNVVVIEVTVFVITVLPLVT